MSSAVPAAAVRPSPMFRVLGPIEVVGASGPLHVPPGRQQIILATMLLDANRVVSIDHLIDAVWDEDPPSTARSQVQICVSTMRRTLAGLGAETAIVTRSPGYLLRVPDDQLDLQLCESAGARSADLSRQGRREEAAEVLRGALRLWRGPALGGGGTSRLLRSRAIRLDERRLNLLETLFDLELGLGLHRELIERIASLADDHPLRERLRSQLMLALYRSGRKAEALEVYRAARALFIEQLGLEPGEELRSLESAVLAEDEALQSYQAAPAAAGAEQVVQPRQLPADLADFTGRDDLVARAEAFLVGGGAAGGSGVVRVAVIAGMAGVGKSTLAMHVAHRVIAARFPGGQLYSDLRGSQAQPAGPAEVLARFLRALGIPGSAIPPGLDERAEMYRSMLAGRRILIVLDDAAGEAQVAPLLPGSATCAVIVTSRARLAGLPGSELLDIDIMDRDQALDLLRNVLGAARVAAEPAAAAALVRVVGGLPLALRIVAARLVARPHWSLASMVGRLADERRRLDELAHGDMVLRASLSLTYDGLEPATRRLLRLLGMLADEALPGWVADALLDEETPAGTDLLEHLVDVQMLNVMGIDANGDPRYQFHDLIRVFARDLLLGQESRAERVAAVGRVAGGWLAMAEEAHRRAYGGDFTVLHGTAPRWRSLDGQPERILANPLNWLEGERANLCSMVALTAELGQHELCWDLAVTLVTLFEARSYLDDWRQTHEQALEAVQRAGNQRGTAAVLCSLGSLHVSQHRPAAARSLLDPAMRLFTELGDTHGQAMTWRSLGVLEYNAGRLDRAADLYQRAGGGFRAVGDLIGEAYVLNRAAQITLERGHYGLAASQLKEALRICRKVHSPRVEAQVLHRLGEALQLQQRYAEAEEAMSATLELVRHSGDRIGESYALRSLGLLYARLGKPDRSEGALRRSLLIREKMLDEVGAARVRLDLAELAAARGDTGPASALAEQALETFLDRGVTPCADRARALLASIAAGHPPSYP